MQNRQLIPFHYNGEEIRTITDEQGETWFVAKDVCEVLELGNTGQALSRLDDDEKNSIIISDGTPGNPNMAVVNEPGLYSLILTSRKPEAKTFKRWITHEVLPQIRRTGGYSSNLTEAEILVRAAQRLVDIERRQLWLAQDQEQTKKDVKQIVSRLDDEPIDARQKRTIHNLLQQWGKHGHYKYGYANAHKSFQQRFGIRSYDELPQSRIQEAVDWLTGKLDEARPLTYPIAMRGGR